MTIVIPSRRERHGLVPEQEQEREARAREAEIARAPEWENPELEHVPDPGPPRTYGWTKERHYTTPAWVEAPAADRRALHVTRMQMSILEGAALTGNLQATHESGELRRALHVLAR